ncbi:hypothetical protein [uncultured Desulfosarcina sp.]|uniref:hypothetical protein n=1 Tax=uncultured Desulfosarcina sp. TaxID=218289 RepID=UPI0029C74A2E|nr:hypothetical protein [uncultured Desulfosarcina sp.]
MKSPIRTTLVYGLICALIAMPAAGSLAGIVGGSIAFKLVLWTILSGYSLLLARWSGKHPAVLLFPLILLLGTAVWPGIDSVFFFLGLGVLCWLRSGICFSGFPLRAMAAETVAAAGGAALVALLGPGNAVTWAISIWLFFLVQALYFFIVPHRSSTTADRQDVDPFEQAQREAQRILESAG